MLNLFHWLLNLAIMWTATRFVVATEGGHVGFTAPNSQNVNITASPASWLIHSSWSIHVGLKSSPNIHIIPGQPPSKKLVLLILLWPNRAGDSVLYLISACQSDDWEGIFVALGTSSSIYLHIISLNLPHLQLVTPL